MIREAITAEGREENIEALQQAMASSNDLLSVLNTILEISNIESDELVLSNSLFKMEDVADDVNNLISSLCRVKGVAWEPHTATINNLSVEGDRIRLMQALIILLRNAVKFANEEDGKVSFTINLIEETDNTAVIGFEVSDNGIGMTAKKLGELSQIFALDNKQINYSSSEIMLSACNSIVKAMGAQIMVESKPGMGTRFSFVLNLTKAVLSAQPEEIDIDNLDFTGKRVLVVDDVLINRVILKNILTQIGIESIEAKDGKEAFDLFLAEPESIHLILMDIMMPVMDGYEATQKIRASGVPNARTIPIIAVTALSYKEDVDVAINVGMDFHLGKPVEPNALLFNVARFLKRNL
jgi:CheY-like chemotaxis protein